MAHVNLGFEFVQAFPQRVVMLGIEASGPEVQYGWIEPGVPVVRAWSSFRNFLRVRRFHEKPPMEVARELFAARCLWNSFVVIGNIRRLIGLIARALPDLYCAFNAIGRTLGTSFERKAVECLYRDLPAANFSYEVLQNAFSSMAVLPVTDLEWSDLGTPDRLLAVLRQIERGAAELTIAEPPMLPSQPMLEKQMIKSTSRLADARAGLTRVVPAQR
jgi:mannose-1-phosphate guanylyltransferase